MKYLFLQIITGGIGFFVVCGICGFEGFYSLITILVNIVIIKLSKRYITVCVHLLCVLNILSCFLDHKMYLKINSNIPL